MRLVKIQGDFQVSGWEGTPFRMVEKTLHDIRIIETKSVLIEDKRVKLDPVESTLAAKVEECIGILGKASIITLEVVTELLAHGQLRLQFKDYSELVELADKRDIHTLAGAAKAYEEYMAGLHGYRHRPPSIGETTQRIRVQAPKVELPKPKPRRSGREATASPLIPAPVKKLIKRIRIPIIPQKSPSDS
jgi:hypothetical protein